MRYLNNDCAVLIEILGMYDCYKNVLIDEIANEMLYYAFMYDAWFFVVWCANSLMLSWIVKTCNRLLCICM